MLDVLFALNCGENFVISLILDKPDQTVSCREAFNDAKTMFLHPASEIGGDARVYDASSSVCHDVNPAPSHTSSPSRLSGLDPRIDPAISPCPLSSWPSSDLIRDQPGHPFPFVMAGRDPAISLKAIETDSRVKPANDEKRRF